MAFGDILTLRAAIASLLDGQIGTYTYQGGLVTPALRVEDGRRSPSPQTVNVLGEPTVSGLEVVIVPESGMEFTPMLDSRMVEVVTEIILKQWDADKSVRPARELIISSLEDVQSVGPLVPRNSALESIESCSILLSNAYCWF